MQEAILPITQSVFSENNLSPTAIDTIAVERIVHYNITIFILLFICCTLTMYVYLRYPKKSVQVFGVVIRYSMLQQAKRDGHTFFRAFSISVFLMYIICGGIFFSDFIRYEGWLKELPQGIILWLAIAVLGVIILLRIGVANILGMLLKEKTAAEDGIYQYAFGVYVGSFGLVIFCLLLQYSQIPQSYIFTLAIGVGALLYALRMLKILAFGYSVYGFSLFHLILYLCAVEILPLAIFIKVLMNS